MYRNQNWVSPIPFALILILIIGLVKEREGQQSRYETATAPNDIGKARIMPPLITTKPPINIISRNERKY